MRSNLVCHSLNYKASVEANHIADTANIALIVGGTFALGWYVLALLPINAAVYYYLRWQGRKDPWAAQIYGFYSQHADHYDPWTEDVHVPEYGQRPFGFGRGLRI